VREGLLGIGCLSPSVCPSAISSGVKDAEKLRRFLDAARAVAAKFRPAFGPWDG